MENIKLKKIKPVLELQYPLTNPERGESDFRESLLITKQIKPHQEWDKARNSVALDLIHARSQLDEAHLHLKKTREVASKEYLENDRLWKDLQSREEALKASFEKFEQFVCENEDKRTRARKKIRDEIAMQKQRTEDLEQLKKRHGLILGIKNKLEQNTKDYRIYEDFLNGVVAASTGQFRQVTDVIKRYESLVEKRDTVLEKRNRELDELDQAKVNLLKLIEDRGLEIMTLNSKVVELIRRHEKARNHALQWELVVAEIKHHAERKRAEMDSVRLCIRNMHRQMCQRRAQGGQPSDRDYEGQAMLIRSVLVDLERVHTAARKRAAAEESAVPTAHTRRGAQTKRRPGMRRAQSAVSRPEDDFPIQPRKKSTIIASAVNLIVIDQPKTNGHSTKISN